MAKKSTDSTTKKTTTSTAAKKEPTTKASTTKKTKELTMLFSEIEKRAYEIYLARQAAGSIGNDIDDWTQAEADIKNKYNI